MSYNKKQNKHGIKDKLDRIWNLSDSPISSMIGSTHLEINGNNEVIVEGCKSIVEYDENIIKISTKKMFVAFFGRSLTIKCLTTDSLVIKGFITSIEFLT